MSLVVHRMIHGKLSRLALQVAVKAVAQVALVDPVIPAIQPAQVVQAAQIALAVQVLQVAQVAQMLLVILVVLAIQVARPLHLTRDTNVPIPVKPMTKTKINPMPIQFLTLNIR